MRSLILAAMLSLPRIGQPEPLPDADYAALALAVIDQVAIPAYAAYAQATKGLGPAIEAHCMGSSAADAAAVRTAFDETMDAWQRAWPFTFGPVMHGAGRARIAFWPDRRGSASRQMRTVLRARDEALLNVEKLAGKSVAIKDLQALERLLFAVPRDAYTCGLARTIARHQSELAAEILDAWTREDGFRQTRARRRRRQRPVRGRCRGRPRPDALARRKPRCGHRAEAPGSVRRAATAGAVAWRIRYAESWMPGPA